MGKKGGKAGSSSSKGGGGDATLELDPAAIRFAHSKICPNFSGCGRSVLQTLEEIKAGALRVDDLPMITVVRTANADDFVSLNNRRLFVIKEARSHTKTFSVDRKIPECFGLSEGGGSAWQHRDATASATEEALPPSTPLFQTYTDSSIPE